eukprot:GCRY01001287.1.p1 GENE.GCRY01001287.1~~GCRY01001287.1.p1  ORF type:complete len:480 (+),score=85.11 GCRY01001287.1:164-1603(+)
MDLITIIVYVIVFCILLTACALDLTHNPMGHSRKFVNTRFFTIIIMGLTYAMLFSGRYNWAAINTKKVRDSLGLDTTEFGFIATIGLWAYAASIIFNGVVIDKIGGKRGIFMGAVGSGICNGLMGLMFTFTNWSGTSFLPVICVLVALNNFFQSFGSLAIVKIGAYWYHLTERGFFSGVFGVVVGFGFFLALNVNTTIMSIMNWHWCFFFPSIGLFVFALLDLQFVFASPVAAGFEAIEEKPVDDKPADPEEKQSFIALAKQVLSKNIFLVLVFVEIGLGWCRDGILYWYTSWFDDVFHAESGSGPISLAAGGITVGAMFGSLAAGILSDVLFGSRRPPVAFVGMFGYTCIVVGLLFVTNVWQAAILVGLTSLFFSSVHGITVSTCAMDFAGSGATGTAVGLLDGTQKVGSGIGSVILGKIIHTYGYKAWLHALIPMGFLTSFLLLFIIKRKPAALEEAEKKDAMNLNTEKTPLLNQEE